MVAKCKLHCVTFIINRKASREITIKNVMELNSGFFFFYKISLGGINFPLMYSLSGYFLLKYTLCPFLLASLNLLNCDFLKLYSSFGMSSNTLNVLSFRVTLACARTSSRSVYREIVQLLDGGHFLFSFLSDEFVETRSFPCVLNF